MSLTSIEFLLAALVCSGFYSYLPSHTFRRALFAGANVLALSLALPNTASWVCLAGILLSGFVAATTLARRSVRFGLASYLFALVAVFVFLKRYAFLPDALTLHAPIQIMGLSYMLFRQIHFVVDTAEGTIVAPSAWVYLNYQLNFFGLLAGPIQRFQDFDAYWQNPSQLLKTREEVLFAVLRVLRGMLKVSLIGAYCLDQHTLLFGHLKEAAAGEYPMAPFWAVRDYVATFYLYPAYVYFNFSGYCDVAIGAASLFGLRMPENFDRPWLSRNMIEFWTRQHITLGFWIRDYLFTPLYKAVAERMGNRASSYAFVCYFVALFLAGVWHGSTLNFVVFGLVHGAGVSITKAWENHLVRRLGRKGLKLYLQRPGVRALAVFTTFNFVSFAFMFFTPDLAGWWLVTKAVGRSLLGAWG